MVVVDEFKDSTPDDFKIIGRDVPPADAPDDKPDADKKPDAKPDADKKPAADAKPDADKKPDAKPDADKKPAADAKPDADKKPDAKPNADKKPAADAKPDAADDDEPDAGLVRIKKPAADAKPDTDKKPDAKPAEFDFQTLGTSAGVELKSEKEVVSALKEWAEMKKLSPAIQKAIEIEKNKGDVAAYFRVLATNPDKLSEKEVLWESFAAKNPKAVSQNEKFARLDFERSLSKEYAILREYESKEDEEKEEFFKTHKDEIEYLQQKYKVSVEDARASLKESQSEIKFYEPGTKLTEKEVTEMVAKHVEAVSAALSEFKNIAVPVGDDFEFKVTVNDSNKELASRWMKNPEEFLNALGFGKTEIDYDKFIGYATLLADIASGNFGAKFRESVLSMKDIQTLETDLNPPPGQKSSGAGGSGDEWDQIGDKAVEARKGRGG